MKESVIVVYFTLSSNTQSGEATERIIPVLLSLYYK